MIDITPADNPRKSIASHTINNVTREKGRVFISYSALTDSLYHGADTSTEELAFVVKTKDTAYYHTFGIMLNSNYRDAFTRPEVGNNRYYRTLFKDGNPLRESNEDPLGDPAHYWP